MDHLDLGWRVNSLGDPAYWLRGNARPGSHSRRDLVIVPAEAMGHHTVVVAQSGSGKSFFLGRLVEELLLHSKARCIILDPDGDFRKVREAESAELWTKAAYDRKTGLGKLPTEASRDEFASKWAQLKIAVVTAHPPRKSSYEPLTIWWPSVSEDFIAEDLDPIQRIELHHCHSFVRILADRIAWGEYKLTLDAVDIAEELLNSKRSQTPDEFYDDILEKLRQLHGKEPLSEETLQSSADLAYDASNRFSNRIRRFYFAKFHESKASGILAKETPRGFVDRRLVVIDLPSLRDKTARFLAVNTILEEEWNRARIAWQDTLDQENDRRAPTFIVLDEAHSLIPSETQSRCEAALREQFRTIAAEGRKYGLFLILVTQRPDKLDSLVLSECENKAIMGLDSDFVLKQVCEKLGLEDVKPSVLRQCVDWGRRNRKARALLVGRWTCHGPCACYGAARRTREGGRNLRAEYWATPA